MTINVTPIPRLIDLAAPAFTLGTTNAAGDAVTAISSNSTLLAFDTTLPDAITFGQSGAAGSATVTARRDHVHAMEAETPTVAATQAEMEAASSTTVFATPGRTQYHPGVAKAWCQFHHTNVVDSSYNITSVSNTSTGEYTVTLATDMSGATYVGASMAEFGRSITSSDGDAWTAGTARLEYASLSSGNLVDISTTTLASVRIVFFGDQ